MELNAYNIYHAGRLLGIVFAPSRWTAISEALSQKNDFIIPPSLFTTGTPFIDPALNISNPTYTKRYKTIWAAPRLSA